MTNQIKNPEEFFGFQLGSDRKIARWDKIVGYFNHLDANNSKIKTINMGPSTEGNPFLLVIITSPENHANLEEIRKINNKIADPRNLSKEEINDLISKGKAVICQSMSLHASEIGGTQMAPELAWDLITREDKETLDILDNVVFLMVPSFNPDGQIIVTDWYNQWLETEYEGVMQPWLYHKYTGHDNNRDAFMQNIIESQYMAKIMFQDWTPQAYLDHHHMGSYGARLYIPPYSEPIHPHGDPLIWREHSWLGAHMAYKLEEHGKTGIINGAIFSGWAHMGFHWLTIYHNIAGMLTESASAKLATPLYIHPEQLRGAEYGNLVGTFMMPHYKPQTNFPNPWPGGWWRLRDIVEQQKISAWALLDMTARNKETVLKNAYLKAKRQTKRGKEDNITAYILSPRQHDPLTAELLVEKLSLQGVEIKRAKKPFTNNGLTYPENSYLFFLDQPKMGVLKTLIGRTFFPDDAWTRDKTGFPYRPYDTTTDTMNEFMGVQVDAVKGKIDGDFEIVTDLQKTTGKVHNISKIGYVLDGRLNKSFAVVNELLNKDITVRRLDEAIDLGCCIFPPGSFLVTGASEDKLNNVADKTGVNFYGLEKKPEIKNHEITQLRVAMYQRYWGGNMDEGWTRLVLEQNGFPYFTIKDEDIKEGNLNEKYDVIILPNDSTPMIIGGDELKKWYKENVPFRTLPNFPPEYRSGIGEEGVENLKKFVEEGGSLVCLGESSDFAIEKLELKVKNVLKGLQPKEFYCPGSTLRTKIYSSKPLAYGMPDEAFILFWNSFAFDVLPHSYNERYEVIVKFPERDILQSGWLIGENKIRDKIAMLSAEHGKGKAILIGFRTQHRAQTHGTYKLLFNTLIS
jgi:hypothetical protein